MIENALNDQNRNLGQIKVLLRFKKGDAPEEEFETIVPKELLKTGFKISFLAPESLEDFLYNELTKQLQDTLLEADLSPSLEEILLNIPPGGLKIQRSSFSISIDT